jgi:hypothetical protein
VYAHLFDAAEHSKRRELTATLGMEGVQVLLAAPLVGRPL